MSITGPNFIIPKIKTFVKLDLEPNRITNGKEPGVVFWPQTLQPFSLAC